MIDDRSPILHEIVFRVMQTVFGSWEILSGGPKAAGGNPGVNTYTHNGGGFAWEITGVRCFHSPLCWQPTPGCVIFSHVTPDLHARISSTVHIGQDLSSGPL